MESAVIMDTACEERSKWPDSFDKPLCLGQEPESGMETVRLQAVPFWVVEVARNSRARKNWSETAEGGLGREKEKPLPQSLLVYFSLLQSRAPSRLSRKGLLAV